MLAALLTQGDRALLRGIHGARRRVNPYTRVIMIVIR
jgi:hypothetical protein